MSRWSFHDDCRVLTDVNSGKHYRSRIETLLGSDDAFRIRRHIGRFSECRHCTEPGLERYSLPYEGWTYLSLLPKMGKKQFLQMHRHMGLDKYITNHHPVFPNHQPSTLKP